MRRDRQFGVTENGKEDWLAELLAEAGCKGMAVVSQGDSMNLAGKVNVSRIQGSQVKGW